MNPGPKFNVGEFIYPVFSPGYFSIYYVEEANHDDYKLLEVTSDWDPEGHVIYTQTTVSNNLFTSIYLSNEYVEKHYDSMTSCESTNNSGLCKCPKEIWLYTGCKCGGK